MRVRFLHRLILLGCASGLPIGGAEAAQPVITATIDASPQPTPPHLTLTTLYWLAPRSPLTRTVGTATETEWLRVKMHRELSNGARQSVELLRPASWVTALDLSRGKEFDFAASESALSGRMLIDSIDPVRGGLDRFDAEGGTRMVTGRFVTENAQTYVLTFDNGTKVRATANHPLYSLDRQDWAGAGSLAPGERLQTVDGALRVLSVEPHRQAELVYNLEVQGDHVYYAGESAVLSHNGCGASRQAAPAPDAAIVDAQRQSRRFHDIEARWLHLAHLRDRAGRPQVDSVGIEIGRFVMSQRQIERQFEHYGRFRNTALVHDELRQQWRSADGISRRAELGWRYPMLTEGGILRQIGTYAGRRPEPPRPPTTSVRSSPFLTNRPENAVLYRRRVYQLPRMPYLDPHRHSR